MDELIKELKSVNKVKYATPSEYEKAKEDGWNSCVDAFNEILSRHEAKTEEPLAKDGKDGK